MEQKPQNCQLYCLMPMQCNFRLTKRRSDQILRHNVSLPNLVLEADLRDQQRKKERDALANLPKIHNTISKLFLSASHTALQAKIFARTAKSLQCKSSCFGPGKSEHCYHDKVPVPTAEYCLSNGFWFYWFQVVHANRHQVPKWRAAFLSRFQNALRSQRSLPAATLLEQCWQIVQALAFEIGDPAGSRVEI